MNPEDRRRWLLMIVVFAAALLFLQMYSARQAQQRPQPATEEPPRPGPGEAAPPEKAWLTAPIKHDGAPLPVEVQTDEMKVTLSTTGASVAGLELLNYHPTWKSTEPLPVLGELARDRQDRPRRSLVLAEFRGGLDFEHWPFKLQSDDGPFTGAKPTRTIVFVGRQGDIEVRKVYTFSKAGFDIGMAVTVINCGGERQTLDYRLLGGAGIIPDQPPSAWMTITAKLAGRDSPAADMEFRNVTAVEAAKLKPEKLALSKARTEWAALRGRFFAAILVPQDPTQAIEAFAEPLDAAEQDPKKKSLAVGLKCNSFTLEPPADGKPGGGDTRSYFLRVGPQKAEMLEAYFAPEGGRQLSRDLVAAVDFGWNWFARASRWMLRLLQWSHGRVANYGLAIVLMTLIIKVALHPLQRKGTMTMQKNQEKMQAMAPKLKVIQEQYKDDPAKLQAAQMRLYKEEGFNPAGFAVGCLPMLFQAPVFIALYGAIRGAFDLRQAGFLWVHDLSLPDTLFGFNLNLHFWQFHVDFNLLPILYGSLQALQSFSQPMPVDPQQKTNAWMMRFMPLMFFFIFYSMPSGFVLYFAVSATLGFGETWMIKKLMARAKARAAAGGGAAPAAPGPPAEGAKPAEKPAPVTDAKAFWAKEAEKKLGKPKK